MDESLSANVMYLLLILIVLSLIGLATIIALLATWRNYNRRQQMLDKGREQRDGGTSAYAAADLWREAGRRYGAQDKQTDTDEDDEDDEEDDDEDEDDANDADDQDPGDRR